MTDFGSDFSALDDIDQSLRVVDGKTALMQALARRLTTPRGALWYAPAYGYDVGAHVNSGTDVAVIEAAAEAQILDDERVDDADVTITISQPDPGITAGQRWDMTLRITTAEGPFEFTLAVDAVTGALLLGGG